MAENPNNNVPHEFPLPQIQDMDDWLRSNGLRSADDEPPEQPAFGAFMSDLNRSEAHAQQQAQQRYQEEVHKSIFREALEAEAQEQANRNRYLKEWKDETMVVVTADATVSVPLCPLAVACDVVFTMASSRRYMDTVIGGEAKEQEENKATVVRLSLEEYPPAAVQEFLQLALLQKDVEQMDQNNVVDCCQIAHFLQCPRIVEGTSRILLQSIDSDNCLAICQMADQLELPDLFERALFHMLKSLEHLENHETYEDFSPELKGRIADIRAVFTKEHTTNNDNHQQWRKKTTIYATSLGEYISIFAENVQYYRERLQQAKEEQTIQYSPYAQSKIEKQELRVLTLEAMLQEQKRLFGKKRE